MQKVTGRFISTGANTHNLNLGFIPRVFKLYVNITSGATPNILEWNHLMPSEATALYGCLTTGSTGATSIVTTAATGISELNSSSEGAFVPAPNGNGEKLATVVEYATMVGAGTTPTARTTAVIGTVTRPSTRNGFVYECTTASGACLVEPTWGTVIDGTTTDSAANVWTCREDKQGRKELLGVVIGASIANLTDGQACYFEAEGCDENYDLGDAANW